jgi:small-conductance mechanosensitive channel
LSVKSELNYAIIAKFRAAGIEIPYPQRELRWRTGESGKNGTPPLTS